MKKISLKTLNLRGVEQLSRTQLKDVMGGGAQGSNIPCYCDGGYTCSVSGSGTAQDAVDACIYCCDNYG
ncbi:MAG: TIGR04149 family rSAM-modified RiPP [Sphingobacterium sp.]